MSKKLEGKELEQALKRLKEERCETVGQLIAALSKHNPNTKLVIVSADLGGYDVCGHNFGFVVKQDNGSILIDHLESEMYELLPYNEYEKIYSDDKCDED